jgi:hypothetical protein
MVGLRSRRSGVDVFDELVEGGESNVMMTWASSVVDRAGRHRVSGVRD